MLTSAQDRQSLFVLPLNEVGSEDVPLVGGKTSSLGEMLTHLSKAGIRVPRGFAITAQAFRYFLEAARLNNDIESLLAKLDVNNSLQLITVSEHVHNAICSAELPARLDEAIANAYAGLCQEIGEPDVAVAVRSSATAEDLPDASFAGQHETLLNVRGRRRLMQACKECFASLYTARAIHYRRTHGFADRQVALSICVQQMVRVNNGTSGTMFTIDPDSGFRDVVVINASYGAGEALVQGTVSPDEYVVHKPTLKDGFRSVIRKRLGAKGIRIVLSDSGGTKVESVPDELRSRFVLSQDTILDLARWAIQIEDHFTTVRGQASPMDIEWAQDGQNKQLYVLQARPETVHSVLKQPKLTRYTLAGSAPVLARGAAIGQKIASGSARIVLSPTELTEVQAGEVLVTRQTDPDWEPIMKRAAAIVTDEGGRTCHAAIVARELGIPAVIGTGNATRVIPNGAEVTISCAEGSEGQVLAGRVPYSTEEIPVERGQLTSAVKLMMNVADPESVFSLAQIPNDGVGLARMEFVITNHIGIHPLALTRFAQLQDEQVKRQIAEKTALYADRREFFVDRLAQGLGTIAAGFYPKPVIVRFSDFKTNEYRNLLGGAQFEPLEENPMLGWRGAARYYDKDYKDGFALECKAVKRVRQEMGLKNLWVMIPFCRTPHEAQQVLCELTKNGLERGMDGLKVYVMCEIPSNVILASDFAKCFDGFSIGSNDLTQLVLGVDRDSARVARLFDERSDAVKKMIADVVKTAHADGVPVGICGQAPSDYPEFLDFLLEIGIDSISLSPDAVLGAWQRLEQSQRTTAA